MTYMETGPVRKGTDYYPWWLDNLADDVTGEGGFMEGYAEGADNVRTIVLAAREVYDFQIFSYTGDFGDNGFIEIYNSAIEGKPLGVVVTVTRNGAGKCQHLVVNHRPRSSLLLFSRLMHKRFINTPLADLFLADDS
jgi:hypothetical protein